MSRISVWERGEEPKELDSSLVDDTDYIVFVPESMNHSVLVEKIMKAISVSGYREYEARLNGVAGTVYYTQHA